MNVKRIIPLILYMILGSSLIICGGMHIVDSFWSGMGTALLVVGCMRLVQIIRYKTSTQYKEKVDTEVSDERNRFIRAKAWSWAGYLFIIVGGISTIIFKILNMEPEMMMCSCAVCLMLVLYWVSFFILRKKY